MSRPPRIDHPNAWHHIFNSIAAIRTADEYWCEIWFKPIQFSEQRDYARKNKAAKE